MAEPNPILEANLARLRQTEPDLAQRLATTAPAALSFSPSRAGPLSATIEHHGRPLALASRYDPLAEADQLASTVDYGKHAAVVVLGVGLGYHVGQIARQMGNESIMIVFEPDAPLLRAVLERVDHTAWLGQPNIILADERMDRPQLLSRLERFVGLITQGIILVTHPPTRQRHSEALAEFGRMVTDAASYARMHVATALVNSARTVRNLTSALPWYAAGANTDELHNAAVGFPAVCVGAGPSLARNVDRLRDPAVRRNVVLISAQTTLKLLLDRGIRPDFVTALDYSQISRRFYENLPALPDVTLVAEPKGHPSIFDSYPGPIRVTSSGFLQRLLGPMARAIVPIRDGSTVAHLSFYLAQHLGCDPIILIGQDLGFSDGLYYCPGTAIHDVWAPELGPYNTLEMMEWQRIVRHRGHLHKLVDVHGRPIFSDEQMVTYLKQFERDFGQASQTVLDATEGGLAKQNARAVTLAEALAQHATRPAPKLPIPPRTFDAGRLADVAKLLQQRSQDVRELQDLSRKAIPLLKKMIRHQRDAPRMNKLFAKLNPLQRRVDELQDTFSLVNELNTVGAFRRARADRAINSTAGAASQDMLERQRRQLERDIENITWIIQACDETLAIFADALQRVRQCQPKTPRRPAATAPTAA